ncbi:hypothetical protein Lal_00020676 [Lupinus albus]|uniref:Uncharacterized protein n=1 Tax=Lupinus albus TaxID=3870 RepID=A0A6A4Q5U9_LUPAL|nr:hypothetical protein Lalb_Chr08g0242671 [Lupinus albus]KAF1871881.1 hypothetical protein Lal_00020676 [Lupinus albus]
MGFEDSSNQVSIAFPLGLSLLVGLLVFICSFFCCYLHWEKFKSLFSSCGLINLQPDFTSDDHQKPVLPIVMMKRKEGQSLPVMMPGDKVPKFVAIECPHQPFKG